MSRTTARTRSVVLAAALALPLGPGADATAAPDSADWGPVEQVPAAVGPGPVLAGAHPDGTLVAVWETDRIERSTRAPRGAWTPPTAFPVADARGLEAVATLPGGALLLAYTHGPPSGASEHRVVTWEASGAVGQQGPANGSDDYVLTGDGSGDVVAERLGGYDEVDGFDHVLHHFDGTAWRRLPGLPADPGDVVVPGPGESVWAAGYDVSRSLLRVRRWTPRSAGWEVQWSRDYPSGHLRRPLVEGLDLAAGGAGRAVLAFEEREVGIVGPTVRAVARRTSGWTRPWVLQRLAADGPRTTSTPVVAAAGGHAEVAWTSSTSQRGVQAVRVARLARGRPHVERLAGVPSVSGFRDLSLDLDVRGDGDVLVTYLEREDTRRALVGWLGRHDGLRRTRLVEDAGVMPGDAAFLVDDLAAVVRTVGDAGLVSRVAED